MHIMIAEREGAFEEIPFSFDTTAEELALEAEDYAIVGPIHVEGRVLPTGIRYRVEGEITCTKSFDCDRCLKPAREEQTHEFEEEFSREARPGDETDPIENDRLVLDTVVRDIIIAAQPLAKLCKADCKGLCPVCGQDLNEGSCGCDTFVPDPRLAVLQDFFKDNKN